MFGQPAAGVVDPGSVRSAPGASVSQQHVEKRGLALHQLAPRHDRRTTHSTRSTSGNSRIRPDPRGHSSSKVLLDECVTSRSPSQRPDADPLPARLAELPEEDGPPAGGGEPDLLFELRGRRRRAGPRPTWYSPLGTDQAASSLRAQNGPPGWAIRTSTAPPGRIRYSRRPALVAPMGRVILPPGAGTGGRLGILHPSIAGRSGPSAVSARSSGDGVTTGAVAVARLSSRSGGPSRSHLGGTGVGRSIRPHVFELHTAR